MIARTMVVLIFVASFCAWLALLKTIWEMFEESIWERTLLIFALCALLGMIGLAGWREITGTCSQKNQHPRHQETVK